MDTEILKLRLYQGLSEDLRKWFKDGGWDRYNTKGEKVGKCARDDKDGDGKADGPKPKCLPASKAASLGKKKIASAVKRKRAEDPNPDRKGAAKNVSTESVVHEMISTSMSGKRYRNIDNAEDQARISKEKDRKKAAKERAGKELKKELAHTRQTKGIKFYDAKGSGYMKDGKKVYEGADLEHIKEFVGTTIAGTAGAATAKKGDRARKAVGTGAGYAVGSTLGKVAGAALGAAGAPGGNIPLVGGAARAAGSALGSTVGGVAGGVGGAVAGNKLAGTSKKKNQNEEVELDEKMTGHGKRLDTLYHYDMQDNDINPDDIPNRKAKGKKIKNTIKKEGYTFQQFNEKAQKCWDTHKKVGMKMKGGKLVNNCVPKNEEADMSNAPSIKDAKPAKKTNVKYDKKMGVMAPTVKEATYPSDFKNGVAKKKTGRPVQHDQPTSGGRRKTVDEGAAWTKKSGKSESGGLNEKGRKSYERENPGSDLKAPSKTKGNKRRASFCARMSGMKKKLTSKKTANDPDSRINKSLRAWDC